MSTGLNRRDFLKAGSVVTAGTSIVGGVRTHLLAQTQAEPERPRAANDHIQFALIGAGGQGQYDTKTALEVPGVKLVAVADCYDGRLTHAKELWGDDVFTTRDYAVILSGEIDMKLDDAVVHLKQGDVVIQQATNHAWINRGTQPCRILFLLMDAKQP